MAQRKQETTYKEVQINIIEVKTISVFNFFSSPLSLACPAVV
jgi:hypothetical protein